MKRYALKRVLLGFLTLIGDSMIIFVAVRLSGDPVLLLVSPDATEAEIRRVKIELGLHKPIPNQYAIFMKSSLRGDFGRSTRYRRPALELVMNRLPATVQVAFLAFAVSITLGITIGVISATKPGSWLDFSGKTFAMLGQSMPEFWIGIMAILVFSVKLGWLPTSGRGGLQHLILQSLTLGWFSALDQADPQAGRNGQALGFRELRSAQQELAQGAESQDRPGDRDHPEKGRELPAEHDFQRACHRAFRSSRCN